MLLLVTDAREELRVRLAKHLQQTGASTEQVTVLHQLTELASDTAADDMPEASVEFTVTTVKTLSLLLSQKSARSTIEVCLRLVSSHLQVCFRVLFGYKVANSNEPIAEKFSNNCVCVCLKKFKAAPNEHQTQTVLKVLRSVWTAIIRNGLKSVTSFAGI